MGATVRLWAQLGKNVSPKNTSPRKVASLHLFRYPCYLENHQTNQKLPITLFSLRCSKMCDAPHYQYTPLYSTPGVSSETAAPQTPKPQRPIRLLRLRRGNFDDDIRVELENATIDELEDQGSEKPYFEALSYVWGPRDNPAFVWIGERMLPVTQNLAIALRHLRYNDEDAMFWIDAICIDQSNTTERSRQVALMKDIFCLAPMVVFWLGPEGDDSSYALELIHNLGEKTSYDPTTDTCKPVGGKSWEEAKWLSPSKPVHHGARELNALRALTNRSWFERLWIRQEAFFRLESGILVCGRNRVRSRMLLHWIRCLCSLNWDQEERRYWDTSDSGLWVIYSMSASERPSLKTLRYDLYGTKCEDDRDRIFAVLNMLPAEEQQLGISSDYSLPKMSVYRDTVVCYLRGLKDSTILAQCELQEPRTNPSWVPDWSNNAQGGSFYNESVYCFRASGQVGSHVALQDDVLSLAAVVLDTIESTTSIKLGLPWDQKIENTIRHAILHDAATTPYIAGGGSLFEAYTRAFVWGNTMEAYGPFLDLSNGTFDKYKEAISNIWQGGSYTRSQDDIYLRIYLGGWYIPMMTFKGYVGMGPRATQPGDIVCVVLGCQRPLVLRPATGEPTESPSYVIVGQCYLSGFMHGEALLGKLPERYYAAVETRDAEDNSSYTDLTFIDINTDARQWEDPRLSSLGIDLGPYRKEWGLGKPVLVDVEVEVLRAKGVDVRWLDII